MLLFLKNMTYKHKITYIFMGGIKYYTIDNPVGRGEGI